MSKDEVVEYIKKSFELKNQGFYKPAIEMLYKALSIKPDNIEILSQLAHLYKNLNNYERSFYYIDKVLEIDNSHIDSLSLLEELYIAKGDLQSAKEICEKIYSSKPTEHNLKRKICILNKLQDFNSVKKLEESLTEMDEEVLYEISCVYYNNCEKQKAKELLEMAYSKNNKNVMVMQLLAKIYYDSKDFLKSKKLFEKLIKKIPTAESLNFLGLIELEYSNVQEAGEYFSKAKNIDPQNAEYAYNLACAYFSNGWMDEALNLFNQAICLEPENVNYHYSLAYLYYQKQMFDKAMFELDFIYSLDQHHSLSNILKSMIKAKKGDLLSAKNELEKIIKNNANDDFAYYALSKIYFELSQFEDAKKSIEKAIEIFPKSLTYLAELIEIEIYYKNYEKALELSEKLIEINSKYLNAYVYMAKINLGLENYDAVYDAAQEMIDLDPNCPEGYYYNAIALFNNGDKNFAIESLKKSISLDLNNPLLYAKMSEFYQELGDFKNAYIWINEASEIDERNYQYKWLCAKLAITLHNQEDAIKNYSKAYRLAQFDKELVEDYANYLKSIGKNKQAEKCLKCNILK